MRFTIAAALLMAVLASATVIGVYSLQASGTALILSQTLRSWDPVKQIPPMISLARWHQTALFRAERPFAKELVKLLGTWNVEGRFSAVDPHARPGSKFCVVR